MPIVKISEETASQYVDKLNGLLAEYDQHIRNDALKTLKNIYHTNIKTLRSISKGHEDIQREINNFEKQATTILNGPLFDFETAIEALNSEALNQLGLVIFLNKDLLIIKQKQDGIKILQGTLRENGKLATARLEDFVQVYQDNNTFHNPLQNPNTPVLFARRRHQDGILHNFWKAVDAILTKLGFGVSTTGVTGAKVDKKIWGMFEKAGVKKADMEVEQKRRHLPPLGM